MHDNGNKYRELKKPLSIKSKSSECSGDEALTKTNATTKHSLQQANKISIGELKLELWRKKTLKNVYLNGDVDVDI